MALSAFVALMLAAAAPPAPAAAAPDIEGCFDLSQDEGVLTLTGTLSDETTAKGRAPFTLEMGASICVRGVSAADPRKQVDAIDVAPPADLLPVLRALAGSPVTLTGRVTVKPRPDSVTPLTLELREIHVVAQDYQIAG